MMTEIGVNSKALKDHESTGLLRQLKCSGDLIHWKACSFNIKFNYINEKNDLESK